jgi:hypothetical protein
VVAVALAAEVARLSAAAHYSDTHPPLALRLAPGSPDALTATAMTEVGHTAATAGNPEQATFDKLQRVAAIAPLQPEPLLVQAALAERQGNLARAESLLKEARWRNPRSNAARYLLADVWLRQNKVLEGLNEMAVLSRLLPDATVQLVPALSEYAHSPGAREKLAGILQSNPQLKRPLLNALAADPNNMELVLALAGPDARSQDPAANGWKSRLLNGFVSRGDYGRAYSLWRNFAALPPNSAALLFNGEFKVSSAPPPFNWSYNSSSAGFAEPQNGKLRVFFYGRDQAPLASQTLLLPAGRYRFDAPFGGTAVAGALTWTLTCVKGSQLLQFDLSKSTGAQFAVPPGCAAQMLALTGSLLDMPQDSDVQIGPVRIERVGA